MGLIRYFLKFMKWTTYLALSVVLVLVLILSTESGRGIIVRVANSYLDTPDYSITISSITSLQPLSLNIESVKLSENKEPWLAGENINLSLDWLKFLRKDIANAALTADKLILTKIPGSPDEATSEEELELPFSLNVALSVDELILEPDVIGERIGMVLPHLHLEYDKVADKLQSSASLEFMRDDESFGLSLEADGKLNDFGVRYHLSAAHLKLADQILESLEAKGHVDGLPWSMHLGLDVHAQMNNQPLILMARAKQGEEAYLIEQFNISSPGLEFSAKGEYNQPDAGLKGHALLNLEDPPVLKSLSQELFEGQLITEAEFSYVDNKLDVKLKSKGQNIRVPQVEASSLRIEAEITDVLNLPDGHIKAILKEVEVPVGPIQKIQLQAKMDKGKSDVLATVEGQNMNARLAADAKFMGDKKKLNVRVLSGNYEEIPFELTQSFQVFYEPDLLTVTKADLKIFENPFSFQGKMIKDKIDFYLRGKLDLLLLTQFYLAGGQVVTGVPEFDLRVLGTTSDPRLQGRVQMLDGSYEDPNYGTLIKDISFVLEADQEALHIENFKATDGDKGSLNIAGQYNFGSKQIEASLKTNKFRVAYTDQSHLVLRETDINLGGPILDTKLSGKVTLDELSYDLAQIFGESVETLNVVNLPETAVDKKCAIPAKSDKPSVINTNFDIDISIPPVARFYGLGVQTLWKGDLKVTRTLNNPLVNGIVSLDQGSVDFLGQMIKMERGEITFDGQDDNIPFLEVHGEVKKAQTLLMVDVTGRASTPRFQFSSDPAMPQDEVISYLLFGKGTDKLSPLEAVRLARALNMYRNPKQGAGFAEMLTNNLGLDQFSLGGVGDGLFGLSLTKRFSDRVRVGIDQGLKPEDSKVEAEVDLTDNINLKAEHGLTGSSDAVSLNYNWNY